MLNLSPRANSVENSMIELSGSLHDGGQQAEYSLNRIRTNIDIFASSPIVIPPCS